MKKYIASLSFLLFILFQCFSIEAYANESYFYFRCNSTSWDTDNVSLLVEEQAPGILEVTYDVKDSWHLESGDDCVLMETPLQNAWGAWQKRYVVKYYNYIFDVPKSYSVTEAPADQAHFKVRYPELGSYTAVFNTHNKTLTIKSASPAEPGEVVWTTQGGLFPDTEDVGFGYFSGYYSNNPAPYLSLIDLNTGETVWSLDMTTSMYPNMQCSNDNVLVGIYHGDGEQYVLGIDKANGETLWTQDMSGELINHYAYLSCHRDKSYIILRWGEDNTLQTSINKADGSVNWTMSFSEYTYPNVWGDEYVVFQSRDYSAEEGLITCVDNVSGETVWQLETGINVSIYESEGELFASDLDQGVMTKRDWSTGAVIWDSNLDATAGVSIFTEDGIYFQKWNDFARRIDRENGNTLWQIDFSDFAYTNTVSRQNLLDTDIRNLRDILVHHC